MKKSLFFKIIVEEFRCAKCNRLLFKSKIFGDYYMEIKCPRCRTKTEFQRKIKKD